MVFSQKNEEFELVAVLDGKKASSSQRVVQRKDVQKKYANRYHVPCECGFYIRVYPQSKDQSPESFALYAKSAGRCRKLCLLIAR